MTDGTRADPWQLKTPPLSSEFRAWFDVVDDVPVLDSLGTCVRVAELRASQHRATGLHPARVGFYGAQPPRALVDAARDFYGVPKELG